MDADLAYLAVRSRDQRFDGMFFTAVTTTRIYCRPSCPAITPRRENVRFYATAAAAQAAGFRACKRCVPGAAPGSPEWDLRGALTARALRLIADGVVEREGVPGLAQRLGYSERHLRRHLAAELGAGPLAVARSRRAHVARVLLESTDLPVTEVAFAAGFDSVRQFNATMREVFAATPSQLRARPTGGPAKVSGAIELRLAARRPFDGPAALRFLAARAVPGVEEWTGDVYRRSLRLPHGTGIVELRAEADAMRAALTLDDPRDLATAVARVRRLLDLDADPAAVAQVLAADPLLRDAVVRAPGLRVPGSVDPAETAIRAILGQQVSVGAARTIAGRLAERFGEPLRHPVGAVRLLFPTAAALASAEPADLPMPGARARALRELARGIAAGEVVLDVGADRDDAERRLRALPGVGAWTAAYIRMRALGDPDAFLPTDLGVRHGWARLGGRPDAGALVAHAEAWRPWRAYAVMHLWHADGAGAAPPAERRVGSAAARGSAADRGTVAGRG
jgi:AraC family transcriptional regulator of adaptative response / DNA-3-methyladenine glycosylase II